METPVLHAYSVWPQVEYRLRVKVKVTKNMNTTVWAITFELEVVEISVGFKMSLIEIPIRNVPSAMTYDVPFF